VAFAEHTDWATAAGLPLVSSDANRQTIRLRDHLITAR